MNDIINTIYKTIERYMSSKTFTDYCIGLVDTINPLSIKLDNENTSISEKYLILTDGVIEKKFTIQKHLHKFDKDYFKHNHGAPLTGTNGGLTVVVSGQAAWVPAGSQVVFQEGSQALDLSGELKTLDNEKPTESTVIIMENGKEVPLIQDKDDSEKYWVIINQGLKKGDKVVLLRICSGNRYMVLSRFFEKSEYVE